MRHRRATLGAALTAVAIAMVPSPVMAQPPRPNYLPFAEFVANDNQSQIDLKKAYNDAVEHYNQVLYDYYATLEQHDRLVDLYQSSSDAEERQRAKDEAAPLRARLATLRREATTRLTAVDQAARRAQAAGVTVRP